MDLFKSISREIDGFKILPIELISKERSALMGFSILWVVLFHYGLSMPFTIISYLGFTGVDLFVSLSAYGLTVSMSKNPSVMSFYKRRIVRIFPSYIVIGLIAMILLYNDGIVNFLFRFSTLGFWTNGLFYDWYIPSIVALYLIFPMIFFYVGSGENRKGILLLVLFFYLLALYHAIDVSKIDNPHYLILYRTPLFILASCPYFVNVELNKFLKYCYFGFVLFVLLSIVFVFTSKLRFLFLSTTFLTPCLLIVMSFIFRRVNILHSLFSFVGNYSLEIYIVFMLVYYLLKSYDFPYRDTFFNATTILLLIITVVGGVILNKFVNKILLIFKI